MAQEAEKPALGGFDFEAISPELRAVRAELSGYKGALRLASTLEAIAQRVGMEPDSISRDTLLELDFETLRSAYASLTSELPSPERLLASHILGSAALVAHHRSLWHLGSPKQVADLSELVDILPRQWGEICARAVPLAEDLLDLGEPGGAQFLLGGYEVFEPIGHGGMGQVRRGRDHASGQWVAIKFLSSAFQSQEIVSRFDREGRFLDSLDHEGVAKFLGQGVLNSMGSQLPYLVMEYLEGEGPMLYAERCGLTERGRLLMFIKICAAVEHAHSKGVIHRDLHPGNILVTKAGQPKVLDFGVARCIQDQEPRLTSTGQVFGVAAYLSPEQASGKNQDADVRMDVYSLGAILFELLSGQTPHVLDNVPLQRAWNIVASQRARRLRQVLPNADKGLERILARALAFEVRDRYATLHAFVGDLHAYLNHEALNAPELNFRRMARILLRRHRDKLGLGMIAMLLLVGSMLWALWSWNRAILAGEDAQRSRSASMELAHVSLDILVESLEHSGPHPYVQDKLEDLRTMVSEIEDTAGPEFASLLAELGRLEGEWAYLEDDLEAAARHFIEAEAGLESYIEGHAASPELLAQSSILLVRIGDTAKRSARRDEALALYQRALEIDRQLAEESGTPRDQKLQDNYCWSLIRRIELLLEEREFQRASELLAEALGEVEHLLSLDLERAHSYYAQGRLLNRALLLGQGMGWPKEQLSDVAEQGAASARRAVELDPGRRVFLLGLQAGLRQLGDALRVSNPERSRELLLEAARQGGQDAQGTPASASKGQ